jgi:4-hydroxy-tetrahydrodipicolinate reductase
MEQKIRVLQLGLGFIGLAVHEILAEREEYDIVGAVDPDPTKADSLPGIKVSRSLEDALDCVDADVAVVTTTSSMNSITPQVLELVHHKLHVISTCEELVYPWLTDPESSMQINAAAKVNAVSVLSTGVNPGFLMDFLPVIISKISRKVDRVVIDRTQNATPRREEFQRKIGASMTVDEFNTAVAGGSFGHAGLIASLHLLATGLGWRLDSATETIEPVIAREEITTEFLNVKPGNCSGTCQVGIGMIGGSEVIRLSFKASVDAPESYDKILCFGTPDLEVVFPNGVPGDIATGAITVNSIPAAMALEPGLHTMADLWSPK